MTRKHFTEIINEADSDEDDKTCTDSVGTRLAATVDVDEGLVLDHTTKPSSTCFQGSTYHTHICEGVATTTTVTGGVHVNHSNIWLPSEPPPLVHYSAESMTSSSITNPFTLTLISGNISVCRGCRQRYVKPATPPIDLCIRHKEWQDFIDPTGHPQQRFGNVYYHCNIPCILTLCPTFSPVNLQIDSKLGTLTEVHLEYLRTHMPGRF